MKWLKIRIKTTTEAEDIIISSLYDIGLEGAQIEDNQPLTTLEKEQMFVDLMPELKEDDGIAYLSFFIEKKDDGSFMLAGEPISLPSLLSKIEDELNELKEFSQFIDIGEGSISISETADLDWVNNWKQYFHTFSIDDILVVPSWEEVPDQNTHKYILRIDPGTAFGTGKHETTQLCIRQLKEHIKNNDRILDIGCGSGILAILSLKFGAGSAFGTDLDPCALAAVKENLIANNISTDQFKVVIGDILSDEKVFIEAGGAEKYDIVVANILTEVLVPLTPVAYRCLKKGGFFITSGILKTTESSSSILTKEEQVITAMEKARMEIIKITYQGEWVSITAQKI